MALQQYQLQQKTQEIIKVKKSDPRSGVLTKHKYIYSITL